MLNYNPTILSQLPQLNTQTSANLITKQRQKKEVAAHLNKSHQIAALTLPPSLFCPHHPPQMTASLFFPQKNWLSSLGKHQKVPVGLPAGEEARRPANSQMSCLCNKRSLCLGITSRDLTLRPHCSFCMPVWLNWELFFAQGGWKHQVVDPSDKGFYRFFVRNRHPHYIAYTPVDTCQEQRRQPNGYTQKKKSQWIQFPILSWLKMTAGD